VGSIILLKCPQQCALPGFYRLIQSPWLGLDCILLFYALPDVCDSVSNGDYSLMAFWG